MKKISKVFFSMSGMGFLLLIFAASIATATFIENDFGTSAAKAIVYNAVWFDVLLALLAVNLIANIFRMKMYRRKKLTIFIFHLAFLIILLGSAITRFISYEGLIHLREGASSDYILTNQTYVEVSASKGKQLVSDEKKVLLSVLTPAAYHKKIHLGNQSIVFQAVRYIPYARKVISEDTTGRPAITLIASLLGTRQTIRLGEGETEYVGDYGVEFGGNPKNNSVHIRYSDGHLQIIAPDTIHTTSVIGGMQETLPPSNVYPFVKGKLYVIGNLNLLLTNFYKHAKVNYVSYNKRNSNLPDVLVIKARSGDDTKKVALWGGKGTKGKNHHFQINGIKVVMNYGAKQIELPFSLRLNDFQLQRYPGSMSPSSYSSEVTVIDKKNNEEIPFKIYMNHVLNYKGFRFFQSSYDKDELGSILSVNHDYWGTFFTYLGYLLMALGMAMSLLNRNSHFAALGRALKKTSSLTLKAALLLVFLTAGTSTLFAQHNHLPLNKIPPVNKVWAHKFGMLMTQSNDGRLKPVNTLSSELLRKITGKSSFYGMNSDQVLLGMLSNPLYWQLVPMIKVTDKKLSKILGIKGKYASYLDFINMKKGGYKLQKQVKEIYSKKPESRSVLDKEILKVDERLNICYMIFMGDFLKIIPDSYNPNHSWYFPGSKTEDLTGKDSSMVAVVIPQYFRAVSKGNKITANRLIADISAYQKKYGQSIYPSQRKINAEILYNKLKIFDRLGIAYGVIGFIMVLLLFIEILKDSNYFKVTLKIILSIIILGFVLQTFGLILRWYISNHAPWSDGYESMVYIAWVTMLAGLLFSKRSMMTVAATTILSSIILLVAHLSWMDPEITNLVPVLKSYWLTIHVSIITASYGFLALSALLGFINLMLMIMKSPKNYIRISQRIGNLTVINERSLIIGLYMLIIGTFLGGVWANESWGRYWGWDPKETWALVCVLIYSFIAHMRFIPGLKSEFIFNMASLLGYSSILMTFFGVNYYLSGLHSYAKGDVVPIPGFVYYTLGVILIVVLWAYRNEIKIKGLETKSN